MKEDVTGIPDVDLTPVKADLEAQAEVSNDKPSADLGQFKTADDLLKSYKEIQGAFTKVSQENKSLKEASQEQAQLKAELEALREQQELMRLGGPTPSKRDFDSAWMENPENAINERVQEAVRMARIEDVLAEQDAKNPAEFQERYAYVDYLAKNPQYSSLARTPAGVRKLFSMADKIREDNLKKVSRKSLEHLLGVPIDDEKLDVLKKRILGDFTEKTTDYNNAYMPDGSTSTKSGADSDQKQSRNSKIRTNVEKGDVDGVLNEMFKDILAE